MKKLIGLIGSVVVLAAIYFGVGTGTQSPKQEAVASVKPTAQTQKPIQTMNLALGDMVFLAQDLGYSIKSSKDFPPESNKITVRLEGHLQRVRELYRQETAQKPELIGSLLLQFNISATGEVSQVKELSARINDAEFKKAVIAEVAKWSFAEIVSENLTVTCPLLFVREGMDITTLVLWEKFLGDSDSKPAKTRNLAVNDHPVTEPKIRAAVPIPAPSGQMQTAVKGEISEFQIKYSTLLRKEPNFSSTSLLTFTLGTKVTLVKRHGDWLEVSTNGQTGFIRKEFVKPVDLAQQ